MSGAYIITGVSLFFLSLGALAFVVARRREQSPSTDSDQSLQKYRGGHG